VPENPSTFEKLPNSLKARLDDDIAILALARIEKRNALDDATILGIEQFFDSCPSPFGQW
jgi:(methylthio)acryloyl-CoA hydratase